MTREKVLEKTIFIDEAPNEIIYRAYVPFFRENVSSLKTDENGRNYRVVEGAIIVDRRNVQEQMGWTDEDVSDHYTTLWDIDGLLTDVRKINFDFRHNNISTGAVGERTWVVDDYPIEINGRTLLVRARMLAVRVYTDNQIRIKGKNGETLEDGNLLESIQNGRVFTWSVYFKPVRQTTTRSGLTVFKTYHTPNISFLDNTQGIPDAGGFTLRNFLTEQLINNNNIMLDNIKQALEQGEITKEELRALVEEQNQEVKTPEVAETTPAVEETPNKEEEKLEAPNQEVRGIEIEVSDNPLAVDGKEEEPNPDTNQDGDISDEEMRSYYSNLKRIYSDPKMISDKMDEAMRMCGELKKRMDEMTAPKSEEEGVDVETQRERALNSNLDGIPEKKEELEQGSFRQLGEEEKPLDEEKKQEVQRFAELKKETELKQYNNYL